MENVCVREREREREMRGVEVMGVPEEGGIWARGDKEGLGDWGREFKHVDTEYDYLII